ncbi:TetR/AcrR family transcriptional regulator [Telmatobacter bradus]|uniref:TetR/AcrR family transcriptional regulator n=1 Tax=Telmatobacter bradus TaxID=474953 RepID=UPI003B43CB71
MTAAPTSARNKHQLRTEETQSRILDAAEAIFSEQGFEKTQLEEVAARAGFTRGAIYAHYAGKEDLFLALMKRRVLDRFSKVRQFISAEPEQARRPEIFREWLHDQAENPTWAMLMLEFKLYVLRRPQSHVKLREMYDLMTNASGDDFIALLFGHELDSETRANIERRLSIMGAAVGGAVLESCIRPELFPAPQRRQLLDELFSALVRA